MDCDFSFYCNSFIAFKTEWKSWNKTYQLILYTEDHEILLIIDSQTPSYTPVLIEHRGAAYVAYIDESFSIHVLNIDTREMVKLLIYGYSYGIPSSRKLERAIHHNVSFIWLMGGLKPDHKTIAEFRRKNKKAVKKVLRQCAKLCIELDLIAGNTLFIDLKCLFCILLLRQRIKEWKFDEIEWRLA